MTEVANVYGGALYDLARDENLAKQLLDELDALNKAFSQEPAFLRLLSSAAVSKAERCQILDDSFRGSVHQYVLNFLKILTEKGYMRHFSYCCDAYLEHYDQDNGILRVNAVSAVELSTEQKEKLTQKLSRITGKEIALRTRIDPRVLGGIRLDYDGQRLDDTVSHRLDAIRDLLDKTVL